MVEAVDGRWQFLEEHNAIPCDVRETEGSLGKPRHRFHQRLGERLCAVVWLPRLLSLVERRLAARHHGTTGAREKSGVRYFAPPQLCQWWGTDVGYRQNPPAMRQDTTILAITI